jgi:hypothetical protein
MSAESKRWYRQLLEVREKLRLHAVEKALDELEFVLDDMWADLSADEIVDLNNELADSDAT